MKPSEWVRSSFCDESGCVEVQYYKDSVLVRDSLDFNTLVYTEAEWEKFLLGVKVGEFDVS